LKDRIAIRLREPRNVGEFILQSFL
jgi:hypothetical protein